ncbi:MAG: peptidase S9 [Candidatus Krumholzibacteriia bacterium]
MRSRPLPSTPLPAMPLAAMLFTAALLTAALLAAAMPPAAAQAQGFGRNKVQYERFDFQVVETEHFQIYHYLDDPAVVDDHARMAERWYARLRRVFGSDLEPGQPLVLYANHADFQQTNVVNVLLNQGTGGVTEGLKNRIVLPLTPLYEENDHVIGHELVHAFQFTIMNELGRRYGAQRRLPLWFVEGMAEYLSVGGSGALTAMWLRDAALRDEIPTIEDLGHPRYFPYRWGHALWAWLASHWGDESVDLLMRRTVQLGFDAALEQVLGLTLDDAGERFQEDVRRTAAAQLTDRIPPQETGEPLALEGLGYNFAPALSPDGRTMALLSQQEIHSIDLYLVDAVTGEVQEKLADSRTDEHFDALRFMNSAGAWSPDGRRFAFVVFAEGDNRVALLDVASRQVERTVELDGVDAITDLAWSPDGTTLAVAGTARGRGDLFLYRLDDGSLEQLTDDAHGEIMPAWSPDGRMLAFVTDRGADTDLQELRFGSLKIGLLDFRTGRIALVALDGRTRHISPQFSPDGHSLYFIGAPDGFSDVFRYDLGDSTFHRVTRVATGVTGLTGNSPALSVARETGRLAFTVFHDTEYLVRTLPAEAAQGEPLPPAPAAALEAADVVRPGARLPPLDGEPGLVDAYLSEPLEGLPRTADYPQEEYDPDISLVHVGQSGVGVSVDRFGTNLGGGATFLFSDMLGNRILSLTAMLQGSFDNAGAEAVYQNLGGRWNWGVAAGHIPYRSAFLSVRRGTEEVDGEVRDTLIQELIIEHTAVDRAAGVVEYPLSVNRRWELAAGYSRISYHYESQVVEYLDDVLIRAEERDLPDPAGLDLFESSLAYVGDYSFFGFTSPVTGKRFRLEVSPTFGTLDYATVLADYRHYFQLAPALTLAMRGLHYGRYLGDAEDRRLSSLYVGQPTLVRGYELEDIRLVECTEVGPDRRCAEVDRLIGSRLGVLNLELRVPVLGTEAYGLVDFPWLPTELALFLDGGVAWTEADEPVFELVRESTQRVPVFSAGVAARMNLFGVLVLQTYLALPFQRPHEDSTFGFVLAPGW